MERESKYPTNNSDQIISTIYEPATQEKKTNQFSQPNKMKKMKSKKLNTILKKENRSGLPKNNNGLGIKWDNKAIDEQNAYRKVHRLSTAQRHKMKSLSRAKYNEAVIGVENDEYLKNLIKVNQNKDNDNLIKNIIKLLNEPQEFKKIRTKSTHTKVPFNLNFNSEAIKTAAQNIPVFDDVLDYERKITLKNTIINKFYKEVLVGN